MIKLIHAFCIFTVILVIGGNALAQQEYVASDEPHKIELVVSPNPFENEVTITLNGGNKKVTSIRIFDIIGKEVAFIDLRNKSGMVSYKLDFTQLPSGVYFCNIYGTEGIIETKRLSHKK